MSCAVGRGTPRTPANPAPSSTSCAAADDADSRCVPIITRGVSRSRERVGSRRRAAPTKCGEAKHTTRSGSSPSSCSRISPATSPTACAGDRMLGQGSGEAGAVIASSAGRCTAHRAGSAAGRARQRAGDPPPDRRARRAAFHDHRRAPPRRAMAGALGAEDQLGVEEVGAVVAPARRSARPSSRRMAFMPCVSETRRPNPTRRMRGEARGDHAGAARAACRARPARASTRRRSRGRRVRAGAGRTSVDEVEVVVVDVEVDDDRPGRGEEPGAQRLAVVGDRPGEHRHLGVVGREAARRSARVASVEPFSTTRTSNAGRASAERLDDLLHRLVEQPGFVVGGHHDGHVRAMAHRAARRNEVGDMTVGYRPFHADLLDAARRSAPRHQRRRCIVDAAGGGRPSATSFGELESLVNRLAHGLAGAGREPRRAGRVVRAELARGRRDAPRGPQGRPRRRCRCRTGSTPTRCSTSSTTPTRRSCVVDAEQAPLLASVRDQLPKVRERRRVRRRRRPTGCVRVGRRRRRRSPTTTARRRRPDAERPARTMIYTSGTTGKPKGALRTTTDAGTVARVARRARLCSRATRCTSPPARSTTPARWRSRSLAHTIGGTIVVLRKFDPIAWLRLVKEHRVTEHVLGADAAQADREPPAGRARARRPVVDAQPRRQRRAGAVRARSRRSSRSSATGSCTRSTGRPSSASSPCCRRRTSCASPDRAARRTAPIEVRIVARRRHRGAGRRAGRAVHPHHARDGRLPPTPTSSSPSSTTATGSRSATSRTSTTRATSTSATARRT